MFQLVLLLCLFVTSQSLKSSNKWFSETYENVTNDFCNCTKWEQQMPNMNYSTHQTSNWSCIYGIETTTTECIDRQTPECKSFKVTKRYFLPKKRCIWKNKKFVDKPDKCSKQCGGGLRTKYNLCYSIQNNTSNQANLQYYCRVKQVPCNTQSCGGYEWSLTWSECSVPCFDGKNPGKVELVRKNCIKLALNGRSKMEDVVADDKCQPFDKQTARNCTDLPPCHPLISQNSTMKTLSSASLLNTTGATTSANAYTKAKNFSSTFQTTEWATEALTKQPTPPETGLHPQDMDTTKGVYTTKTTRYTLLNRVKFLLLCSLVTFVVSVFSACAVSYCCFNSLERKRRKRVRRGRNMDISSPIPSTLAIGRNSTNALQVLNNTIPINQAADNSNEPPQEATGTGNQLPKTLSKKKHSPRRPNGEGNRKLNAQQTASMHNHTGQNSIRRKNCDGVYDVCCSNEDTVTGRHKISAKLTPRKETHDSVASTVYLTPHEHGANCPPECAGEQFDAPFLPPSYSDIQSISELGLPPPVPVGLCGDPGSFPSPESPSVEIDSGRGQYKDIMEDLTKVLSELQNGTGSKQSAQLSPGVNQHPRQGDLQHIYDEVFEAGETASQGQGSREMKDYGGGCHDSAQGFASSSMPHAGIQSLYAAVQRK